MEQLCNSRQTPIIFCFTIELKFDYKKHLRQNRNTQEDGYIWMLHVTNKTNMIDR